ncbi:MAG: acyl carrier protein [Clostridiales bacterium]|nr:MAG: acyl carrier protein [Clostridiales bacterium]
MMVFEKVASILSDYNGTDVSEISPDTTFAELSLDSLDVAELVMSFEDEFGVTIEMNENLKTVGDITKYIEEKLA